MRLTFNASDCRRSLTHRVHTAAFDLLIALGNHRIGQLFVEITTVEQDIADVSFLDDVSIRGKDASSNHKGAVITADNCAIAAACYYRLALPAADAQLCVLFQGDGRAVGRCQIVGVEVQPQLPFTLGHRDAFGHITH